MTETTDATKEVLLTNTTNSARKSESMGVDSLNQEPVKANDESGEIIEQTFGQGANKRILLVTKGVSLKNIVESSK